LQQQLQQQSQQHKLHAFYLALVSNGLPVLVLFHLAEVMGIDTVEEVINTDEKPMLTISAIKKLFFPLTPKPVTKTG
jgi:hypothetical protein